MVIAKFLQHSVSQLRGVTAFFRIKVGGGSGQNITVRHALAYRHRGNIIPPFLVSFFFLFFFLFFLPALFTSTNENARWFFAPCLPLRFVQLRERLRLALISVIVIFRECSGFNVKITVCS